MQQLAEVFRKLRLFGLRLNLSKCKLVKTEIEYLGYLISDDTVRVNPKKTEAIQKMSLPNTKAELLSFIVWFSITLNSSRNSKIWSDL